MGGGCGGGWSIQKQDFTQPSQMSHNVIFTTEKNFPIRSRYVFCFKFSLTFKAFLMFAAFLVLLSNLYVVLARGKSPKKSTHRDLFKTKTRNKKSVDPQLYALYRLWIGLQPN